MFFSVYKVTNVFTTIIPNLIALTLNYSFDEVSVVGFRLIFKVVLSSAVEDTIFKVSFIVASISPVESSISIFFVVGKRANKSTAVFSPSFNSSTVQSVIKPLTFVSVPL